MGSISTSGPSKPNQPSLTRSDIAAPAKEATLTLAETWGQAAAPLIVMAAWTYLAVVLARRSMRWEPRA